MVTIIACDNDTELLRKLKSNKQIELVNVKTNAKEIIENCEKYSPELLVLDFNDNAKNKEIIIKEIYELYLNKCIIIPKANSKIYFCFNKVHFLLDFIEELENYQENETLKLEKNICDMLWKLRFNMYTKSAIYLQNAILLAFQDNELILDTNELIHRLSILHNIDERSMRNDIDNAIKSAFRNENLEYDKEFFNGIYDGRNVSIKYFISLSVYYLDVKLDSKYTEILEIV